MCFPWRQILGSAPSLVFFPAWCLSPHCLPPQILFFLPTGPVNSELFLRHLPGWLRPILRPLAWLMLRAPQGGAQTPLYCALQEGIEPLSGRYFANCHVEEVSAAARDDQAAYRLWKVTKKLAGLGPEDDPDTDDEQEPRDPRAPSSLSAPSPEKTTISGPSRSYQGSQDLSKLTQRRIQVKDEPTP